MKGSFKARALVLFALATALSCSPDSERPSPLAPDVASIEQSASVATSYYRITERLPQPVPILDLSQLIGLFGGRVDILGHSLQVPSGAVTLPTVFTLRAMNNGYIEVELSALANGLLGVLNIGEKGFRKPVAVTLSYARATNVGDPSRLRIMRLNPDGRHEIMPTTVNTSSKTVTAKLDHFSRYCVVSD